MVPPLDARCYRVAKPGAYFMTFCDWRQLPLMTDAIQAASFTWRGIIPWNKGPRRSRRARITATSADMLVWGTRSHCARPSDGRAMAFTVRACRADRFNAARLVRASQ